MTAEEKEEQLENDSVGEKEKKAKPSDEQMYSALSFTVMLVLVGLPLWWKTTEVYRVNLPYTEIEELHVPVKIKMDFYITMVNESQIAERMEEFFVLFLNSNLYDVTVKGHMIPEALLTSYETIDEADREIIQPRADGSLLIVETPLSYSLPDKPIVIGKSRTIYFKLGTASSEIHEFLMTNILCEASVINQMLDMTSQVRSEVDKDVRRRVPPTDQLDILLTVLNPQPEVVEAEFDVPLAIQEYITPFLSGLQTLNEFHVKSQWLYFVTLEGTPRATQSGDYHYFALPYDMLTHVITPLEKKLGSHVSRNPCLNLVVYIAPCDVSPMHVHTEDGRRAEWADAFLSPKWGGVQIVSPNKTACGKMGAGRQVESRVKFELDSQKIMSVFLHQLRLLLGLPDVDEDLEWYRENVVLRVWEKDALVRVRTLEQLTSAKLTLQSLSKLLAQISNIVINDDVGASIYSALDNIHLCEQALAEGRLMDGFRHSKKAFLASETAFYDPSLLSLLYFPDDQKYAVYIPLFLPVMIPVLISFKQLKDWLLQKLRRKQKLKTD